MSDIKVYMKELEGTSWTDVSSSCVNTNFIIREGFGALGSASDVSKLSIEYKADDLASATLFHTSAKAIRVSADGRTRFEGYTEGNASVKTTNSIGLAWVKLSAFPYSKAFEESFAPADELLNGYKVLDATDPEHSLAHALLAKIMSNLEEPYRTVIGQYGYSIVTSEKIEATANPIFINEGDSYLEILDALLGEFGLARYVKNNYIHIVKPYADNKPITELSYNDILINPSFTTKPYKKEKSPIVTVGRIVSYENDLIYMLKKEGESASDSDKIESGTLYPSDGNLQVDYSSDRENDDVSFLYADGLTYEYKATGAGGAEMALDAIVKELGNASALFRFQNKNPDYAFMRQLKVFAQTAYYKDTSLKVEETEPKARERDDIETRFISTAEQASAYIQALNSESLAERFTATFESGKVSLSPASAVRIGDIPFSVLIRYREDNLATGISKYSGVAYSVKPIATTSVVKKQTASSSESMQYISLALNGFAYTYDADGNLEPADQLIRATVKRFGIADNPVWTLGNTVIDTTATTIEIPASYMTGSVISVSVKVGEFTSSDYIYKLTQGSQGKDAIPPKYQWRLGSSSTEPPVDTINHLDNGSVTIFDGTILAEANTGWLDYIPTPTSELSFIWQRMSVDGGLTWGEPYCLSISTVKTIEIIPSATTYKLSSRGIAEETTSIRCSINRSSTATAPCYWTVYKDGVLDSVSVEGEFIDINIAQGATTRNIQVVATCSGLAREVVLTGIQNASKEAKKLNGIYPVNALPATFNNDGITPLVAGDYCLALVDGYHVPFVFNGEQWQNAQDANTENISEVLATTLPEVIASDQTVPSYSAIYGFFQNFASNTAFIEFLTVWSLLVEKSSFKCKIGIFNNEPVFEITYNNATVFKIIPSTGKVFIGRPNDSLTEAETGFMYDPATEELSSKDRKIVIDGDGDVSINGYVNATDGNFNGTINATAGYFKGDIETGSFSALMKIGGISHTATTGASAQSQIEALLNAYNILGLESGRRYPITINQLPEVTDIQYDDNSSGGWSHFYLGYNDYSHYNLDWITYQGKTTYKSEISIPFTFTLKFGDGQIFKFKNLPTTSIGLESGQVWNDNGTLKIV